MLQELKNTRLENEFYDTTCSLTDNVICVQKEQVLAKKHADGTIHFPTYAQAKSWAEKAQWTRWRESDTQYAFRLADRDYFLWMGECGEAADLEFQYHNVREFSFLETKEACFIAYTAKHLYHWYHGNRFCGCCQTPTVHDKKERMLRCPSCGNQIFPKISPAVIIAVTDGDRLLMSKYAGRVTTRYALIAGYTEIGETIEETVHREVMEEVGLKVKNLRYYKSQPWGRDGAVLMGFFCDLDGSDEIHLDERELSLAGWYDRHALPAKDDGMTLTREMMRVFEEGREPR